MESVVKTADAFAFFEAMDRDAAGFGEVPAEQPVGVLARAPLARAGRIVKIDIHIRSHGESL